MKNQVNNLSSPDNQKEYINVPISSVNYILEKPQNNNLITNNISPGNFFEQNIKTFSHKENYLCDFNNQKNNNNDIYSNALRHSLSFNNNQQNKSLFGNIQNTTKINLSHSPSEITQQVNTEVINNHLASNNNSDNIASHIFSIFNKSNDEQKESSFVKANDNEHENIYIWKDISDILKTAIDKKEYIKSVYEIIIGKFEEEQKKDFNKKKYFPGNGHNHEMICNFLKSPISDMSLKQRMDLLLQSRENTEIKGENVLLSNNFSKTDTCQQQLFETDETDKMKSNKKINIQNTIPFTETIFVYDTYQQESKTKNTIDFNVKINYEEKNIIIELESIHLNNSVKYIKEIIKHKLRKHAKIKSIKSMSFYIQEKEMDDNKKVRDFYENLLQVKEVICQIEKEGTIIYEFQ